MIKENNPAVNQEKTANSSIESGNIPDVKNNFWDVSIKELTATPEVQKAFECRVDVPKVFIVKKVKSPFENKETKDRTQKIEVMCGTTIEDAVTFELTLFNTPELDPKEAINKKYRIIDYKLTLNANMKEKQFAGYAATGLKLVVTKLEAVK